LHGHFFDSFSPILRYAFRRRPDFSITPLAYAGYAFDATPARYFSLSFRHYAAADIASATPDAIFASLRHFAIFAIFISPLLFAIFDIGFRHFIDIVSPALIELRCHSFLRHAISLFHYSFRH
jgi:hypothetical protein